MRSILVAVFALLFVALGLNIFGEFKHFPFNIFQPVGTLLFFIYVVIWLFDSSLWDDNSQSLGTAKIGSSKNGLTFEPEQAGT
jgi:SNF family Na+-dependent transporter